MLRASSWSASAATHTGTLRYLYGLTGVIAGIGGAFVGVFPMNDLAMHSIAALTFFLLGLVTVLLASIDFVRRPDPRFPRWLAAVGAVTVAAFAIFLVDPVRRGQRPGPSRRARRGLAAHDLRVAADRRHPAVGVPDRLDVAARHDCPMKPKRRAITSTAGTANPQRTPSNRRIRPSIQAVPARRCATRPRSCAATASVTARPRSGPSEDVDLSVDLGRGLVLANPILVASGTFGYGIEYGDVVDVDRLGAICCKGTTLRPRIGNPTPRVTETPGGMLNSIGLQNPGVDAVIEKYAGTWTGWKVPVIVNVAGESVEDYVEVARRLDGVPGVAGIELNISCPNVGRGGLQFAIDAGAAGEVTAAVRRATDLPLLVKLSPNVADIRPIAKAIADAGADALTAINTLSGIAVAPGRQKPLLGNIYGGLSAVRRSSRSRCGSCTRRPRP